MTIRNRPLPTAALALLSLVAVCGDAGASPPPGAPAPPAASGPAAAPGVRKPPPGAAVAPTCTLPGAGPEPDAAGLRALVRRRSGQLRDCYQKALKRDASAGGRATLRFKIDACGRLSDVRVVERQGRVDAAAACAARAFRGWRTPFRPAEPVTVEYPVSFSASM